MGQFLARERQLSFDGIKHIAYQILANREERKAFSCPPRVDSRLERGQPCPRVSGVQIKFARTRLSALLFRVS
jgi:hypothetical protein